MSGNDDERSGKSVRDVGASIVKDVGEGIW